MGSDAPSPRRASRGVGVMAIALVAAGVCGWLGLWQWDRAHSRAAVVQQEEPRPIADVLAPSSDAAMAVGHSVTVRGEWGDDAALVWGREVDGIPSVFLLRSLRVPADQTGTGTEASLAVLVGYRPSDEPACADPEQGMVTVTGYFRATESPPTIPVRNEPDLCGALNTDVASVAELARVWDGPLYSAVLAADDGSASWTPLPRARADHAPQPSEPRLRGRMVGVWRLRVGACDPMGAGQ